MLYVDTITVEQLILMFTTFTNVNPTHSFDTSVASFSFLTLIAELSFVSLN